LRTRTALLAAACLLIPLVLAGCGQRVLPPEAVVRAWNDGVTTGQDDRAAKLIARDAVVIDGASERVLHDVTAAAAWNRSLPCAGLVRKLTTHRDIVTVTLLLGDRSQGSCAARNGTRTLEFEVRNNKIVFVRTLASTPAPAGAPRG
jgi:hypothetical protein